LVDVNKFDSIDWKKESLSVNEFACNSSADSGNAAGKNPIGGWVVKEVKLKGKGQSLFLIEQVYVQITKSNWSRKRCRFDCNPKMFRRMTYINKKFNFKFQ
jgi:hypothetical protein